MSPSARRTRYGPRPETRRLASARARAGLPALLLAAIASAVLVASGAGQGQGQGPPAYALIESWPLPRWPGEPIELALGADGQLLVADGRDNAVHLYDADGAWQTSWPHPPFAQAPQLGAEEDTAHHRAPAGLNCGHAVGNLHLGSNSAQSAISWARSVPVVAQRSTTSASHPPSCTCIRCLHMPIMRLHVNRLLHLQ